MDYKKLSKVLDKSRAPFKKGDLVEGTLYNGKVVKGKVESVTEDEVVLHGSDKHSFYRVPISTATNLTAAEKASSSSKSKLDALYSKLHDLQDRLDAIWNSPEMEEWYSLNPNYSGEEYPEEFKDQIEALESKIELTKSKIDALES